MRLETSHIYNEDFSSLVKKLKRRKIKVDAIITDPPYNISRDNNFQSINRAGIDFGTWDKEFNQKKWIKSISDLVNDGGSVIIFNDWKNMGIIASALENNNFVVKDLLRWEKTNPMPRNTERRYVTDFEFAIWAVKGNGKWIFNKEENQKYLRPKFNHAIVTGSAKRIHPTQKPVKLIRDIIKSTV